MAADVIEFPHYWEFPVSSSLLLQGIENLHSRKSLMLVFARNSLTCCVAVVAVSVAVSHTAYRWHSLTTFP